jgi:anaerobic magnesium-protoporphyrin IX monomethyl ester cyclase
MRILLIQPDLEPPQQYCPPLGIGYLGTVLLEQGHEVFIIDMDVEGLNTPKVLPVIEDSSPDVIGITSTVANAANARSLGVELQDYVLIHGGPEPTASAEEYLFSNPGSYVLRGEGEHSLVELVHRLEQGRNIHSVPGLSFLLPSGVQHNPINAPEKNLDQLPLVNRHLYNMSRYRATLNGERAISVLGSRFCPRHCIFCRNRAHPNVYRRRSPQNVLQEITVLIRDFGFRAYYFYDCSLTLNTTWLHELCHGILERKLDIIWQCMSQANDISLETIKLMRQAGCVRIAAGVESGSERSLQMMRKGISIEQVERFIANLKAVGIIARVYLMLGFPWETVEDFADTLNLVKRVAPDEVAVSFVTPFRGTELYGMVIDHYPTRIYHDNRVMHEPAFTTSNFSAEDLLNYRAQIMAAVETVLAAERPVGSSGDGIGATSL